MEVGVRNRDLTVLPVSLLPLNVASAKQVLRHDLQRFAQLGDCGHECPAILALELSHGRLGASDLRGELALADPRRQAARP